MTGNSEFSSYSYDGRDELCLKAGEGHIKRVLLIPPLFDELNRMRRSLVDVMRLLDGREIGSVMPDLPGTNESLYSQSTANLEVWRKALTNCAEQNDCGSYVASFRGSSLIDDFGATARIWRLAPVKGSSLLRAMIRTRIASDKEAGINTTMAELTQKANMSVVNLAGNDIGPQMFKDLETSKPSAPENCRTVRLESDSQPADVRIAGSALWLRAEPDNDPILAKSIVDDIVEWIQK